MNCAGTLPLKSVAMLFSYTSLQQSYKNQDGAVEAYQ